MEQEDSSGSGLYRPRTEAENQSSDGIAPDKCRPVGGMNYSQLDGGPVTVSLNSVASVEEAPAAVESEVKVAERVCEKRKRGRPPRGQARQPPAKKRMEEEDVCFICFDGGSLVLCDRRGCPKAYHPACVKRDEAFFRSRAKWNCGWHICSRCHKAAHYLCYTCTYSLCKGCTKDADYLCVRENKGFCATCMRTIMMIENIDQGNKEMVQVDFDDKSSWEYLFKVYWSLLKGNLSLTLDELTQAQNPWKAAATIACKTKSLDIHHGGKDNKGSISDSISGHLQASNFERRIKEQPLLHSNGDSLGTDKSVRDNGNISAESKEWASKELLELVAHMRDGDTSVLSQFDVQALLLDYIQRNNLRDPRQKSHVICDLRLRNLFGKPRVGHFEMLKLLEFHFITKEDSGQDVLQGNTVDAVVSKVERDGNNDNLQSGKHKKHKTRRKGNERGQQTNLDEYAAINVHNIKLIYLRQNLMESLILDNGKFHDKVVGSFVRIRISSSDQNQDIYRLVQVVGTSKVALPYKIGERTVDSKLEILNLDKKETVSIDEVSNQEFSEVECERLRQTMKCGLVQRLTVGQVQDKAMALQEVRLNDWLETEIMRLSNLRDRASEKGHKKELRECIQKLELLKTPEERERRLHEIPEVHADPNMDPNCEADEDPGVISNVKQDELAKSRYSRLSENGMKPISSRNSDTSDHSGGGVWKKSTTRDQSTSISSPLYLDEGAPNRILERVNETLWKEGKEACSSNTIEKSGNQVDSSGIVIGGWNDQIGSETSVATLSTVNTPSAYGIETEMLWHYRDPNGNIQGPFCMLQLRKWSTTGYFPPDMRVWSINDEEGNSLFLSDVLNGKFRKALPMQYISSLFQEVEYASDSSLDNGDGKHSVSNTEDLQIGSSSQCWDPLNVNSSYRDQPQVHQVHSPVPSLAFTEPSHETSLHQARGHDGQSWNDSPNHGNKSSHGNVVYNNNWDANSGFASVSKSTDSSQQNLGIEFANIPSPMTKTSNGDIEGQTTKDQPSNAFIQDLNIQNLPSPTSQPSEEDEKADSSIQNMPSPLPKPTDGEEKHQAIENKQSPSSNLPVQDSGPTWSCASSLTVGCGTQLPEIADRWGGSPTRAKPSVEEWDSGLVSLSSLKPTEVAADHAAATPISKMGELTPSPYPASSWQAMVTEPIEFSTLAEESVSDLLAEVDAMESEGGLPSPTSVNRGEDLFHDSKTECFTSLGGLIPPIESGKSEVGKIQLPHQLTATEEVLGASSQVNALDLDAVKRSGGQSSTSMEVEVETKPIDVPVNQSKVGSKSQLPAPSPRSRDMVDTDTPPRSRTKPIDTRGGGGTTQETTNVRAGTGQGTNRGNANTNRGTSAGFVGRESHPKYGGERSIGPRDRAFQSRDSGYSRGRPSWSRQSSFGGGGGSGSGSGSGVGSYSRPPHRGQRICKFYESGRCKKGAFCDYLHP